MSNNDKNSTIGIAISSENQNNDQTDRKHSLNQRQHEALKPPPEQKLKEINDALFETVMTPNGTSAKLQFQWVRMHPSLAIVTSAIEKQERDRYNREQQHRHTGNIDNSSDEDDKNESDETFQEINDHEYILDDDDDDEYEMSPAVQVSKMMPIYSEAFINNNNSAASPFPEVTESTSNVSTSSNSFPSGRQGNEIRNSDFSQNNDNIHFMSEKKEETNVESQPSPFFQATNGLDVDLCDLFDPVLLSDQYHPQQENVYNMNDSNKRMKTPEDKEEKNDNVDAKEKEGKKEDIVRRLLDTFMDIASTDLSLLQKNNSTNSVDTMQTHEQLNSTNGNISNLLESTRTIYSNTSLLLEFMPPQLIYNKIARKIREVNAAKATIFQDDLPGMSHKDTATETILHQEDNTRTIQLHRYELTVMVLILIAETLHTEAVGRYITSALAPSLFLSLNRINCNMLSSPVARLLLDLLKRLASAIISKCSLYKLSKKNLLELSTVPAISTQSNDSNADLDEARGNEEYDASDCNDGIYNSDDEIINEFRNCLAESYFYERRKLCR